MSRFAPLLIALITAFPALSQTSAPSYDAERVNEIQEKLRQSQPVSKEDQAYLKQVGEARKAEWAKTHPQHESLGFIPLTDLGKGLYKGEQGGLYANGENTAPAPHQAAGVRIAKTVKPLDGEGRESKDGKIVMISVGMSNTTIESEVFAAMLKKASNVNPKLLFVDCAQGGKVAHMIANPAAPYWKVSNERLAAAGVTPRQVEVAWIKQANAGPTAEFPIEVKKFQQDLVKILHNLHENYPNLKLVYLSTRIYAGFALSPLNPEPHAYESGFAVKWLIADQIAGNPELNYDAAKGPVQAPWIAWGPYLWADGVKPRSDGLTYVKDDFVESDRTHPAMSGREKVAHLLLTFLQKDTSSAPWFNAQ